MTSLMRNYEALPPKAQEIAKAMSDAARQAMRDVGLWPLNNDHAARFDEACAIYLIETMDTENALRDVATKMRKEMGFE